MSDLEKGGKLRADFLDSLDNACERPRHRQWPRLALEDYFKGEADIHIHYIVRVGDSDRRQLFTVLKSDKTEAIFSVEMGDTVLQRLSAYPDGVGNGDGGHQEPVFIHIVEIMQGTKSVSVPSKRIIERLQPLNQCECLVANPSFEFLNSSFESTSVLEDGKIHIGDTSSDAMGVLSLSKRPKKVIESSPSIVKAVTNDQRPTLNIGAGVDHKPKSVDAFLSIGVLNNRVRFSFSDKSTNGAIESVKVYFCPSNLGDKANWQISYDLPPWCKGG